MSKQERVVITGLGPLTSIGIGKVAVWNSILKGKTGLILDNFKIDGKKLYSYYVHRIKNFNINDFGIDKKILNDIWIWKEQKEVIDLFYLLAVVKLALDDSRIDYSDTDKTKGIGLVLTHENPGLDQFHEEMINESHELSHKNKSKKDYLQSISTQFFKRGYELQTFMFIFHIAKALNIHGYSLFINNACASGLYAIEAASDIIKSGKCNKVIVAAADCGSVFKYLWFKDIGMYAKDGLIKPFAKNRDGFITGDGAAGLVLESLDSALRRRSHIYAEYLGGGFNLEGWKVAIPDITSDSYKNAIIQAMQRSKVTKAAIDLLVPHGVGTSVTDYYEAKAITNVFGTNPKRPLVSAFKPYIGHNLGSNALLETVILLLALENNLIPPTLNCEEVDPKLNIDLVKELTKIRLKTVMKTACGFAGYNSAAIFKKIEKI